MKCLRATRIGAVTTVALLASTQHIAPAFAQDAFYQAAASELPGRPGTVIRRGQVDGAPEGADAYRVLYRSTGLNGEPIAVSGLVIVPKGPAPVGGRPVVAWAHPTSGIVPRCAPSLANFRFQQMQGLRDMVGRGYVVAATDYPGLGTPGPHPYLVGISEGRAVLDSIRAARAVADPGTIHRAAVWGHSQGGQATLYAGLLAPSYAPELEIVGLAAAAPATDLGALMTDDLATPGGKNLTAMTLWSWARVFNAPIAKVVEPAAMPTVDRLAATCLESPIDILPRRRDGEELQRGFLSVGNMPATEPWRTLLAQNSIGTLPPQIPVFLAQGTADDTINPQVTRSYMARLCAAGSRVQFLSLPGVGHGTAAMKSAREAIAWIADRLANNPAPSDCR